jgi:hypothetical protein
MSLRPGISITLDALWDAHRETGNALHAMTNAAFVGCWQTDATIKACMEIIADRNRVASALASQCAKQAADYLNRTARVA